jgi:hypothetical protein
MSSQRTTVNLTEINVADFSMEQLIWLDDQTRSLSWAEQDEDKNFWPFLFQRFFARWPVRRTIWPSMSRRSVLTEEEEEIVYEGEQNLQAVSPLMIVVILADSIVLGHCRILRT